MKDVTNFTMVNSTERSPVERSPVGRSPVGRLPRFVCLGWCTFLILYWLQVAFFVAFLVKYTENYGYYFWCLLYGGAIYFIFSNFIGIKRSYYADNNKRVQYVWIIWAAYIVAYVITVGMIFGKFAHKLSKDDGINTLIGTLCVTPVLLILLLQLTIAPPYQKPVLSSSMFAALNIFDGIKMLGIFLAQNEADFDLDKGIKICIVVFACICFVLSPLELARNKFMADGLIKMRKSTCMLVVVLEIFFINVPFLVLRVLIWHKYQTAIFLVKNIAALVIGVIEFLKGILKWGGNATGEYVHLV